MNLADTIAVVVCENGGGRDTGCLLPRAAAMALEQPLDPYRFALARTSSGKPYFPHIPIQASVSHSGAFWLCALGSRPLGIDLQQHTSLNRRAAISRRFFHPDEDAFLKAVVYRDFFDLWAAKESYVKYTGEGIGAGFSDFSVVCGGEFRRELNGAWLCSVPFREGYSLWLCAESSSDGPCPVRTLTLPASRADEMPAP